MPRQVQGTEPDTSPGGSSRGSRTWRPPGRRLTCPNSDWGCGSHPAGKSSDRRSLEPTWNKYPLTSDISFRHFQIEAAHLTQAINYQLEFSELSR